jgi:AAA+ superfamily predicted ATPase
VKDHCPHFRDYDEIVVNESGDLREEILIEEPQDSYSRRPPRNMYASSEDSPERVAPLPRRNRGAHALRTGKVQVRKDLDDNQVLLLFPTTRAFALKTKQWLVIEADYISEIVPSEESIDNLVVGENELKTIRGLAKRQDSKHQAWAADFIEGKGAGQIILLHGPPGVGKTYTVEAIAEWLHRPLLALTVADIGTAETRVERELIKWFALAEAWNAILLVDEADIFLERRQNRDLARNGLVSAFLRRMEYFRGLLFLTTNRVGQIDDAFISRVHVAIGYKALSGEDRQKIWNGFFRKLAKERAGKIQVAPGAKKWVLEMAVKGTAQLNGRDIRNALQTAITLAETECEEDPDFDPSTMIVVVDQSHFQRVLDISNKFHEYVRSIRREDEKKRAAGRFDRNDYWEGES